MTVFPDITPSLAARLLSVDVRRFRTVSSSGGLTLRVTDDEGFRHA
jgi:hypothetical protein